MTTATTSLVDLGDALEASARADLGGRRRTKRRLIAVAAALAVVVPGAALAAAEYLPSPSDVAASMPAGALVLEGTEPTCTVVDAGVEYHCVLGKAPGPELSDYKGTVYQTVGRTQHVNGGCRSLNSAGTEWECYIGQAAVDQQIIGPDFLGQVETGPAVG